MSDEKPLHVQVAEALGWTSLEIVGRIMLPGAPWDYKGYPPGPPVIGHKEPVPHYDTDWSATGPLIAEREISLEAHWSGPSWRAYMGDRPNGVHYGETPLVAVCRLIVALAAAGKLP